MRCEFPLWRREELCDVLFHEELRACRFPPNYCLGPAASWLVAALAAEIIFSYKSYCT